MSDIDSKILPWEILDIIPNPVLVKNSKLEYVWVNQAFEELFSIERGSMKGEVDKDLFPDRQVSQCNGGDLRVLESGEVDESYESVYRKDGAQRETLTRKSRLDLPDGSQYLVGVMHDVTDISKINEQLVSTSRKLEERTLELAKLATTDELTGCSNRRQLIAHSKNWATDGKLPVTLLMFDIDKFKSINDGYGHEVGDAALKHFANIVKAALPNNAELYRYGGEEFVVVLLQTDELVGEKIANEARTHLESSHLIVGGQKIDLTVSAGVATSGESTDINLDRLLSEADEMLYMAKQRGRNCVVLAA